MLESGFMSSILKGIKQCEGEFKGKTMPSDTYHYSVDLHGDGSDVQGDVSIFR